MTFFRLLLIAGIAYAVYGLLKFLFPTSQEKINSKTSGRRKRKIDINDADVRDADFHDIDDEK
ncbi:MAG: hypothetical protein ACE5EE_00115 [Fidelibacterota bacterium]